MIRKALVVKEVFTLGVSSRNGELRGFQLQKSSASRIGARSVRASDSTSLPVIVDYLFHTMQRLPHILSRAVSEDIINDLPGKP